MPDKKIKALLVEDDPMILEMYKARMQDEGWEVFSTDRGSEAVELAKKENILFYTKFYVSGVR